MAVSPHLGRTITIPGSMVDSFKTIDSILDFITFESAQAGTRPDRSVLVGIVGADSVEGESWQKHVTRFNKAFGRVRVGESVNFVLVRSGVSTKEPSGVQRKNLGRFRIHNFTAEAIEVYSPEAQESILVAPEAPNIETFRTDWCASENISVDAPVWALLVLDLSDNDWSAFMSGEQQNGPILQDFIDAALGVGVGEDFLISAVTTALS